MPTFKTIILAIDPGAAGGIAALYDDGTTGCRNMPETETDVAATLKEFWPAVIYLEKVGGFIKGNPAPGGAMFCFGRNVGVIVGAALALGIRLIECPPQRWQKSLGLGTSGGKKTEWKRKLKGEAQARFPHLKVTNSTADALLILEHARAEMGGRA